MDLQIIKGQRLVCFAIGIATLVHIVLTTSAGCKWKVADPSKPRTDVTVLKEESAENTDSCAMKCMMIEECLHFHYNRMSKECQLMTTELMQHGVVSYPLSNNWTLWEIKLICEPRSTSTCTRTGRCPPGFVFSMCGSCYFFEADSRMDYNAASQNCRNMYGSSLLSLETKKEARVMGEYFISQGLHNISFLTSGQSDDSISSWKWLYNVGSHPDNETRKFREWAVDDFEMSETSQGPLCLKSIYDERKMNIDLLPSPCELQDFSICEIKL